MLVFFAVATPVALGLSDPDADWSSWVTAVATGVLALAALATLIVVYETAAVARSGLDDARKTRHAQLLTDLSRRWDEAQMIESRKLYSLHGPKWVLGMVEKLYIYDPDATPLPEPEVDTWSKVMRWPSLLETIGVLHNDGAIGTEVAFNNWGAQIAEAWRLWRGPVNRMRELSGYEGTYRNFQQLAKTMIAELQREGVDSGWMAEVLADP